MSEDDLPTRIERAARAIDPDAFTEPYKPGDLDARIDAEGLAEVAVRAAFPELFADPPSHWLAPMELGDGFAWSALAHDIFHERTPDESWRSVRDEFLSQSRRGSKLL